ncbi:unnamed protein product [Jaminaea pallidilutea]
MQASGSFELARTGRSRPSNLVPQRANSYESWPSSPSFDPRQHGLSSRGVPSLTVDALPPTPVSGGFHKDSGRTCSSSQQQQQRLPGINDLLSASPLRPYSEPTKLMTPPCSTDLTSPPALTRLGATEVGSEEGRFPGPRPEWIEQEEKSTFVGVHPPASTMQRAPSAAPNAAARLSPRAFNEAVRISDNEPSTSGLAISVAAGDATPRLGSFGTNVLGLTTPTQDNVRDTFHFTPRAPHVEQSGVFPRNQISSPIRPPLSSSWNTDLQFPSSSFVAPTPKQRSPLSSAPRSAAMEREQCVQLEGDMPTAVGLRGLGIAFDGVERADAGATAPQRIEVAASPSSSSARPSSSSSTGLTPSLGMARLSPPTASAAAPTSPASPSLRTQSKKRSALMRQQAEASVRAQDASASGIAANATKRSSPTAQENAPTPASPRKRALGERDVNLVHSSSHQPVQSASKGKGKSKASSSSSSSSSGSSTSSKNSDASPWAVFRVKPQGEWKSLGPPGGSKGVGRKVLASSSSSTANQSHSHAVDDMSLKKQRMLGASGENTFASGYGAENKENQRPGSHAQRPKFTSSNSASSSSRPGSAQSGRSISRSRSPMMGLR